MSQTFETLGLRPQILQAVAELGYATPSAVQEATIPVLLSGRDVIAQARTGTGKTAAFALPLLSTLDFDSVGIRGLVLAPTRELAVQVEKAIARYGKHLGVDVFAVYGGQSYSWQQKRLQRGPHIVVATPGRALDLMQRGQLVLDTVQYVVLDEADEMLRMGFIEDVETILAATPKTRQTALFSATMSDWVKRLASKYMRNPKMVGDGGGTRTVEGVSQRYHVVDDASKLPALARLLEVEDIDRALIFTRTRVGASQLADSLQQRGFAAEALHGDMPQPAREAALLRFRRGKTSLLVATDVAARGLDIPQVSHVFNYDFPDKPDEYVHRIGRTARAGSKGAAISLVAPREQGKAAEVAYVTQSKLRNAVMPTVAEVHAARELRFAARVAEVAEKDIETARRWVDSQVASGTDLRDLAAGLVHLARAGEITRPDEDIVEMFGRSTRREKQFPQNGNGPRKNFAGPRFGKFNKGGGPVHTQKPEGRKAKAGARR